MLLFASVALFVLAPLYIIKKRLIDKGVWLAFWWVKYVPLPKTRQVVETDVVKKAAVESVVAAASVAVAASGAWAGAAPVGLEPGLDEPPIPPLTPSIIPLPERPRDEL